MTGTDFYTEIESFFGSVGKQGRLFTALNYKGNMFDTAINTKENPDTIKAEPIYQLMLAKNYKGTTDKADNVIAGNFIAFVKSVGTYHKSGKLSIPSDMASLSNDGREFFATFVKDNKLNTELFGSTLPYLPKGSVDEENIHLEVDYLHKLYNIPTGNLISLTGGDMFEGWNLDVPKFLESVLEVQKQVSSGRMPVSISAPLDVYYDLATGKIYSEGADGKLLRDNKEIEALSEANCYGTRLKECDSSVFECLLSGDPSQLSRCLSKRSMESMFDVAKSEVAQMNPKIISRLLKTFDVQSDKYGNLEQFNEWRVNITSRLSQKMGAERGAKTAQAILGNKKLLAYLGNVCDLVRSNPVLTKRQMTPLSDLPEKTEGKVKYFIKPTNIDRASALSAQLGTLVQQLNVVPQNFTSNPLLQLANVGFNPVIASQASQFGLFQMGGRNCVDETVETMETIYKQILEEMKRNGKDLVDEDKNRIETALGQIKKNNTQVAQALNDLKAFMKLNSAITAGIKDVSLNDAKGSSKIDLSAQVSNLQEQVNRTSRDQVGLITALIEQVFIPMARIASGVSSPNIRQV